MLTNPDALPKRRNRSKEFFLRRLKRLGQAFTEISTKYEADISFLLLRNNQIYIFDSQGGRCWRPTEQELVWKVAFIEKQS
jgi:hypothetical protein